MEAFNQDFIKTVLNALERVICWPTLAGKYGSFSNPWSKIWSKLNSDPIILLTKIVFRICIGSSGRRTKWTLKVFHNFKVHNQIFQQSKIFPKNLSGRVSTFLNLLVFIGAFILQWSFGSIIEMWPATGKGYDPESYQAAFGLLVIMQSAGLIWYLLSKKLFRKQSILI